MYLKYVSLGSVKKKKSQKIELAMYVYESLGHKEAPGKISAKSVKF